MQIYSCKRVKFVIYFLKKVESRNGHTCISILNKFQVVIYIAHLRYVTNIPKRSKSIDVYYFKNHKQPFFKKIWNNFTVYHKHSIKCDLDNMLNLEKVSRIHINILIGDIIHCFSGGSEIPGHHF